MGRLAGGETGAHEFTVGDGRRVVVKWDLDPSSQDARRRAVGLADRLRELAAWPVPRQRTIEADGYLFVIQELVAGAPVTVLTHSLVDALLELHARRVGLERPDDDSRWPEALVETLTIGGNGYCRHDSMRQYDNRTAELVEHIEQIGHAVRADDFAGGDVVHWDLHPGNLLEVGGQLVAVIDTDFVTTGDAGFDLATLAVTSLTIQCEDGVRKRVCGLGLDALHQSRRQAYVGHLLIRFLDWSIRKRRVDDIEFWLGHADRLLQT